MENLCVGVDTGGQGRKDGLASERTQNKRSCKKATLEKGGGFWGKAHAYCGMLVGYHEEPGPLLVGGFFVSPSPPEA